jgi:hypothetical protein
MNECMYDANTRNQAIKGTPDFYGYMYVDAEQNAELQAKYGGAAIIVEVVRDSKWPAIRPPGLFNSDLWSDARIEPSPDPLGGWKFHRVREDKTIANNITTVRNVECSMNAGITQDSLCEMLVPVRPRTSSIASQVSQVPPAVADNNNGASTSSSQAVSTDAALPSETLSTTASDSSSTTTSAPAPASKLSASVLAAVAAASSMPLTSTSQQEAPAAATATDTARTDDLAKDERDAKRVRVDDNTASMESDTTT